MTILIVIRVIVFTCEMLLVAGTAGFLAVALRLSSISCWFRALTQDSSTTWSIWPAEICLISLCLRTTHLLLSPLAAVASICCALPFLGVNLGASHGPCSVNIE